MEICFSFEGEIIMNARVGSDGLYMYLNLEDYWLYL